MSRFLMLLSGVLLIAAGVSYWLEQPTPFVVSLAQPDIDVGVLPLEKEQEVIVTVVNRHATPARVVGIIDEPC